MSGTLLAAVPIALIAGLISFFSPCVLPLVPGYLSYVSGQSLADLTDERGGHSRGRVLAGSILFVIGFSVVFVTQGAFFGYFGQTLLEYQQTANIVLGIFTILLGLVFMGLFPGFMQREIRSHRRPAAGLIGAPLLGFVFSLGWAPCVGPTLATVNALSFSEGSAERGALLAIFYCLGLGIPFLLTALALRRAIGAFGWVKRHYKWIMRFGGGVMVVVGILLTTGAWAYLTNQLQVWQSGFTLGI
ncbi:cytochrome c biogenesis protein CcdA [Streptomyces sp. E11-3]|uniref:cytochrome c biogenesis CcdA family protein n=1 Tax=Streptomyces sp. E11-3 TaxID=3110112 RepID=UPI0039806C1C